MKIKIKDINGNWVWYDTETKQTTSAEVQQGTIRNNAVKSVGADTSTKKGRVMAAHNQTQSYNRRQHKVHNYADQTTRLKQKQQTVSVDKHGEPTINQTDYTPNVESPMIPYTPLEELYIGTKALDLPFKVAGKAFSKASNLEFENLSNIWDPYTTFSARFGYYGNPLERFYGTFSRKANFYDKARLPELFRKTESPFPKRSNNTLQLDAFPRKDFQRTNFTTDRPVVSHSSKNNWDHMDTYIVDPKVVDFKKASSIEPSDTFFPNLEISARPNQVTLISGNVDALNLAKAQGTPTLSSYKLRRLFNEMESYLPKTKGLLVKDGFKANVPADLKLQYATEIQRLQSLRGTPTLKDYNYLEGITGLKSGVTTQDIKTQLSNQLKLAESSKIPIGKLTEDSYKKIYSFTFPNRKEIDGIKALRGWNSLMNRQPFNKVQYDPATYAEDIWAKQNGLK